MSAQHDLLQNVFYREEQAGGKAFYLYEHDGKYGDVLAACNKLGLNYVNRDRRLMVAASEFERVMAIAKGTAAPSILKKSAIDAHNTSILKQDIREMGTISLSGKHNKLAADLAPVVADSDAVETVEAEPAADTLESTKRESDKLEAAQPAENIAPHPLRRSTDVKPSIAADHSLHSEVASEPKPASIAPKKEQNVAQQQSDTTKSATTQSSDDMLETAEFDAAVKVRLTALKNREDAVQQREAAIAAREAALDAGASMPANLQGESVDLDQLDALKAKELELKRQLSLLEKHEQQLINLKKETQQWLQQVS